jgi:hypothetical protein
LAATLLAFGLIGCADQSSPKNPDTAQSTTCDYGFLCGTYLDRNSDGSVSPSEWDAAYKQMDTNGDGQVSQSEFEAAGGGWSHSGGGRR